MKFIRDIFKKVNHREHREKQARPEGFRDGMDEMDRGKMAGGWGMGEEIMNYGIRKKKILGDLAGIGFGDEVLLWAGIGDVRC